MGKNLLSDTDYTSGRDNRFSVSAIVGRVSKIEVSEKGANVRVIMPDRIDGQNQPLISKPVPVLQIASTAKKSFAVPRMDDNVLCVKLPNGTSNYAVIGSFYTSKRPPPVTDPMLDYVEYDDGSTMQFDASTGELTWKLKGAMLWDNEEDFTLKTKGNVVIEIEGDITLKPDGNISLDAGGDVDIKAAGDLTLQGATVRATGNPITLEGIVHTTANMQTDGFHTDAKGPHSATEREAELEARVARLEERLATLEGVQHGN
jgi:phage baseplate assembly protein gpV